MGYMPGAKGIMYLATAPNTAAVNEVQTLTFGGAPAGNYVLNVRSTSLTIAWSAVNATLISALQAALDTVPGVGAGHIVAAVGTMTAGVGTATLTYSGASVAGQPQLLPVVVTPPSPGTLTIALTTAGAAQNPPSPRKGALVMNESTGILVQNTGTAASPVWAATSP